MPYRGPEGFSWQSSDVSTRRRALAAVVLLGAGWAIGFFAGRMSAWLFPVGGTNTAVVTNVTPAPATPHPAARPPAAPPQREAAQVPPAPPAPAPAAENTTAGRSGAESPPIAPDKAPTTPPSPSLTAQTPPPAPEKAEPAPAQRAAKDDTREQDASRAPERGVVLVNPEWEQAPSKEERELAERRAYRPETEPEGGRLADESVLAKCESRYSSFRRSDGTYQPYGRSSRELCPFLSDMPRRSRY